MGKFGADSPGTRKNLVTGSSGHGHGKELLGYRGSGSSVGIATD